MLGRCRRLLFSSGNEASPNRRRARSEPWKLFPTRVAPGGQGARRGVRGHGGARLHGGVRVRAHGCGGRVCPPVRLPVHLRVIAGIGARSGTCAHTCEGAHTCLPACAWLCAVFTQHGPPPQAGAGPNSHTWAPVPHPGTCRLSSHTCLCVPLGMYVCARISVPTQACGPSAFVHGVGSWRAWVSSSILITTRHYFFHRGKIDINNIYYFNHL